MKRIYSISGIIAVIGIALIVLGIIVSKISPKNSSGAVSLNYEKHVFESSTVKDIELLEYSESVKFEKGTSDKLTIEYYTPENNNNVEISEKNGQLSFTRTRTEINYTFIGIDLQDTTTVVTLPKDFEGSLKVTASSGSLQIKDANCSTFAVETSSGSVKVENISSKSDVKINCTSGSVKADSISADSSVSVKTSSGSISISSIACNSLETKSTSGSIKIEDCSCLSSSFDTSSGGMKLVNINTKNAIEMSSTSGSIHFTNLTSDAIKADATSGSVGGTINGKESDYSILSKTTSGSSNLRNSREGSKTLDVNTTSGSIKITFED